MTSQAVSTMGRRPRSACAMLFAAAALLRPAEAFAPPSSRGNALRLPWTATRLNVLSAPSEVADSSRGKKRSGRPIRPNNSRRQGSRPKKNYKKGNQADVSFLRKRTEQLLLATDPSARGSADSDDSSSPALSTRGLKVDRRTFNWLLDSWAFSGLDEAPSRARSLLERMEELAASGEQHSTLRPDVRSYTKLVHAISRVGGRTAGRDAHAVLLEMQDMASEGGKNPAVEPNTFTYTAVVEAYANSGGGVDAARRAEDLANSMERMRAAGEADVHPTARAYNAVISAWAKAGIAGSAQHAEDCLNRMEELYEAGDNDDVKPNVYNFNGVINAWANSGEGGVAARHAQGILEHMEELSGQEGGDDDNVRPTTSSYNAAIDAWAKSGEDDAAERAEELLKRMEGEGAPRPNTRSFNAVLNAWAKSRRPDAASRAESILEAMETRQKNHGDGVGPDATSYSTTINAWGRSQSSDKAEKALALYLRMKDRYESGGRDFRASHLRPNVVVCNSVMNACAFSVGTPSEQSRAVEIAHLMLKELEEGGVGGGGGGGGGYGRPDQVTYGTFLKVCANQMEAGPTRDRVVEVVFRKCVRDGQVGEMVLRELEGLVSGPEMWKALVGKEMSTTGVVRPRDLPNSWTCNVVEGKWARRRRKH